eukprot:scaffold111473_cov41-Phaeocystis_antarctica.AAC.2
MVSIVLFSTYTLGMPHTLSEPHSPLPGEHTLLYPGGVREAFKSTKKGKRRTSNLPNPLTLTLTLTLTFKPYP